VQEELSTEILSVNCTKNIFVQSYMQLANMALEFAVVIISVFSSSAARPCKEFSSCRALC
jgi:hypothetical protein